MEDKKGCRARFMALGCFGIMFISVPLLILVACGINFWGALMTHDTVSGTVTDAYIKRVGKADVYHIVLKSDTTEPEIFWNADSIWNKKFDSADVQQMAKVGRKCTAVVTGWRIRPLSWFRNIIAFECTATGQ